MSKDDWDIAVFAGRLSEARTEKSLSQEDLAKMSGLVKSTISKYEAGRMATVPNAKALAKALKVSTEWLIGLSDDKYYIPSTRLTDIYSKLSDTNKHKLYDYGVYLLDREKEGEAE